MIAIQQLSKNHENEAAVQDEALKNNVVAF